MNCLLHPGRNVLNLLGCACVCRCQQNVIAIYAILRPLAWINADPEFFQPLKEDGVGDRSRGREGLFRLLV